MSDTGVAEGSVEREEAVSEAIVAVVCVCSAVDVWSVVRLTETEGVDWMDDDGEDGRGLWLSME